MRTGAKGEPVAIYFSVCHTILGAFCFFGWRLYSVPLPKRLSRPLEL
jgi:hypothetical protein